MKKFICMILTLATALSLAACGSNESADVQTGKLTGTVSTDGSTSMEKVIGGLGELFMEHNSGITFTYNPHRFRQWYQGCAGRPLRYRPGIPLSED